MRNKSIHSPAECNKHCPMIYSLLSLCSMRRWQYSKAFSLSLSLGGSSLLEEDVADTMDITELSTSERSSAATAQHVILHYNTQSTTPFPAGFKQARYLAGSKAIAGLSKWWDIKAMFGTANYNSTILQYAICIMCTLCTFCEYPRDLLHLPKCAEYKQMHTAWNAISKQSIYSSEINWMSHKKVMWQQCCRMKRLSLCLMHYLIKIVGCIEFILHSIE